MAYIQRGSPFKQDPSKSVTTNSAGELLLKTTTTSTTPSSTETQDVMGYGGKKMKLTQEQAEWRDQQIKELGSVQAYRDKYKIGEKSVVGQTDVVTPGFETSEDQLDPIMYTPKGQTQASWQQRSNVRAIKNLTGQSKRNKMRNLREGNIETDEFATYGTDSSENYTDIKNIDKGTTKQALKDAKKAYRKSKSQPSSDRDYTNKHHQQLIREAGDRHKKMKNLFKEKKKEIKGEKRSNRQDVIDQEINNRKNMSRSGNQNQYNMDPRAVTSSTDSATTDDRIKNAKKFTPFKMNGYGSKNK